MKTTHLLVAASFAGLLSATAAFTSFAQDKSNAAPSPAVATTTTTSAAPTNELADGEVRKIDKENKKVTLRHGEIKSLDMPSMTMVFQVKDAALLDQVKVGDKVKFQAEKSGSNYVVTEIAPVK